MYLCVCKGVRVSEAQDAVRLGARSAESLIDRFGLKDLECCGRCAKDTTRLTNLVNGELARVEAENVPLLGYSSMKRITLSI